MQLYYNASKKYKTPTPQDTVGDSNMTYAHYAFIQKSSSNGIKNEKRTRAEYEETKTNNINNKTKNSNAPTV